MSGDTPGAAASGAPKESGAVIHASCVAIGERGVLLRGASGSGKSDLALRLIDRGARLVSDDYIALHVENGQLWAAPPPALSGRLEVRSVGIISLPFVASVDVAMVVDLGTAGERLPLDSATVTLLGVALPRLRLDGFHASDPLKVELALERSDRFLSIGG